MNSSFQQTGAVPMIVETTAGASHSLTTTAGQKVVVWAKGWESSSSGNVVSLKYNGVTKDSIQVSPASSGNKSPFALMYTEVPGEGTHDITVEGVTLNNVVIIVAKLPY